jgi:hypothetical protein
VWVTREQGLDPSRLVGRIVVHHKMHVRPIGHFGVDPLQGAQEFSGPVTLNNSVALPLDTTKSENPSRHS